MIIYVVSMRRSYASNLEASGHVDKFSDPMIDNKDSNKQVPVDHRLRDLQTN